MSNFGTVGQRIMRGLAWLDEHGERDLGWSVDRVIRGLAYLDLRSERQCVLAMASGMDYNPALDAIYRYGAEEDQPVSLVDVDQDMDLWAREYGFNSDWSDPEEPITYADLEGAWVAVLTARRDGGTVPPESTLDEPEYTRDGVTYRESDTGALIMRDQHGTYTRE